MGSGVSRQLPERLDEGTCRELAGDKFVQEVFDRHCGEDRCIRSQQLLLLAQETGVNRRTGDSSGLQDPQEDEEDEDGSDELDALRPKTHKIRVHMYARQLDADGVVKGSVSSASSAAASVLFPLSSPTSRATPMGAGSSVTTTGDTVVSSRSARTSSSTLWCTPESISFWVTAGDRCTFKWLALVAAQRYAALASSPGTLRHRERQGACVPGGRLLPAYVSTSPDNDSFHDPDQLLFHGRGALTPGQEVWVTLDDLVVLEEKRAAPCPSHWATLAFSKHCSGTKKRLVAIGEEEQRDWERTSRHLTSVVEDRREHTKEQVSTMRDILSGQGLIPEKDVRAMALAVEAALVDIPPHHKAELSELLCTHYLALEAVFRRFASYDKSAEGQECCHTLEMGEFVVFVKEAAILPVGVPGVAAEVQRVFLDATQPSPFERRKTQELSQQAKQQSGARGARSWQRQGKATATGAMHAGPSGGGGKSGRRISVSLAVTRAEEQDSLDENSAPAHLGRWMEMANFLRALLILGRFKYKAEDMQVSATRGGRHSAVNTLDPRRTFAVAASHLGYCQAMHKLVLGYILPIRGTVAVQARVREARSMDAVLVYLYDHLASLRRVFDYFGGLDGNSSTMCFAEFRSLVRASKLMTPPEALRVFMAVQEGSPDTREAEREPEEGDSGESVDPSVFSHQNQHDSSIRGGTTESQDGSGDQGQEGEDAPSSNRIVVDGNRIIIDDDEEMTFGEFLASLVYSSMWKSNQGPPGMSTVALVAKTVRAVEDISIRRPAEGGRGEKEAAEAATFHVGADDAVSVMTEEPGV